MIFDDSACVVAPLHRNSVLLSRKSACAKLLCRSAIVEGNANFTLMIGRGICIGNNVCSGFSA